MNPVGKLLTFAVAVLFCAWVPAAHAEDKAKNSDCMACHSNPAMTKDSGGKKVSLYVDENKLMQSIHGSLFTCVDCHKLANDPKDKNKRRRPEST